MSVKGVHRFVKGSDPFLRFLILLCLLLAVPSPVLAKPRGFELSLKSGMTSVKVSWPEKKGAVKYRLYRVDATRSERGADLPKRSAYKRVKTLKGKGRTSWRDRTAKRGRFYAYYVKAYNRKGRVIACSWKKDSIAYACCGVPVPDLGNNGYGENSVNSEKVLHLWVQGIYSGFSIRNTRAWIYRREAGRKKYKKIASVGMGEGTAEFADKTVRPGRTYEYRARLVRRYRGKTYKSGYSETVKIPAVRFKARYRVENLTPAGVYKQDSLQVTLSMKNSGKYSGRTILYPAAGDWKGWSEYYNGSADLETGEVYRFRLISYSTDQKTWKRIPAKGVSLPEKAPLYLKGEILKGEHDAIRFGGREKSFGIQSLEGMIEYRGPGAGQTYAALDLSGGSGSAYQEWD